MEAPPPDTDADLRRLLIDDFDVGFTEMVRVHQPGIYSGAMRLTGRSYDADDIAQDTFTRAYRSLQSWDAGRIGELRIRSWLWTIALNLCRNRGARTRSESVLVDEIESHADDESLDQSAWTARLALLSEPQRTAVVMRYVLDLPIAEIAEATGRPVGTTKTDISRGIKHLRATMDAEALVEERLT